MRFPSSCNKVLILPFIFLFVNCSDNKRVTESLKVMIGSVNGALIERNGKSLVVYGDPYDKIRNADMILFTHFRRDVIWAGRKLIQNGSKAVAPAIEKPYFTECDSLWNNFSNARFHDYYCQSTKVMLSPVNIHSFVRGGDHFKWEDIEINILPTPGYTRGAISYIAEIDGKKVAFTGDLVYGTGQLFDLYSFQDFYEKTGGYHGYASRLGSLISSLQLIAEQKPDILIPSRGPVIYDPLPVIDTLKKRIREVYRNYLSVSAYRWYYPERMQVLADHILGPGNNAEWMPYSTGISSDPPEWYMHISNSNLVIADDSSAFLIDCGTSDALEGVMALVNSGRIKGIDGIFVTHYHDDHTEYINDVVDRFHCPVYITEELKDILENPGSYQMPCLTTKTLNNLKVMSEKEEMKWKDFTLTFCYYPGQTIYHDAVLFKKDGGESIFFIGDSFTPSGIDDYCLLNRNLLHEGTGYFYCLDLLKELPEGTLLANQHVEPLFAYSPDQIDFMRNKLIERNILFKDLFPWEDINYGVDEQWAKVYPYGQKTNPGESIELSVKVSNHTGTKKTFIVQPHSNNVLDVEPGKASISITSGGEGEISFKINVSEKAVPGVSAISFDIGYDEWNFVEWCEAIIEIGER